MEERRPSLPEVFLPLESLLLELLLLPTLFSRRLPGLRSPREPSDDLPRRLSPGERWLEERRPW